MRRTLGPPAALAMLAVIVAGCSNGTGVRADSSTTAAPQPAVTAHEKAAKFADCMRKNGVSAFPDPDASGALTIDGVLNGSSLDPTTAAWRDAIGVCKHLEPSGFMGHKRSAQEQKQALEFARCVRENGVKDFPDPAADEPLINTYRIPSSSRPGGMAILNAATQKCGALGSAT